MVEKKNEILKRISEEEYDKKMTTLEYLKLKEQKEGKF
jgi:hypothetical protein